MLRNPIEEPCAARAIAARRAAFVAERVARVARIKLTTESGDVFDGDEISQNRMARFVAMVEDGDAIRWVLADNSVIQATTAELKEALTLAGQAQAQLWVEAE
ncbi:DUF4376 domain-containing protein [Salinicola halophyticus]|uniref:DUF4376 domain-containing protein n=1 Tax=Salinicola halophyticus TaxID=1808881 RepID=UPI003F481295